MNNEFEKTALSGSLIFHLDTPSIKYVIFNDPYTIVLWKDGTKTKVKAIDEFDEYNGLCIAVAKKVLGSNTQIKKYVENAKRQDKAIKEAKIIKEEWEKAKKNYKAIEEILEPSKKVVKITEEKDRIIKLYDDGSWEWTRVKG